MTINDVKELLNAKAIAGQTHLEDEVNNACATDDLSDVMAFAKSKMILLTGLVGTQAVRTAKMMNIRCIVFVRGKNPDDSVIQLAEEMSIVILTTDYRMYDACGLLYSSGLGHEEENSD